jgi:hypothetical protein
MLYRDYRCYFPARRDSPHELGVSRRRGISTLGGSTHFMTITPILAEGIPPIVVPLFLVPLLLGVFAVRSLAGSTRKDGASRAGLIVRLVPVLVGGFLLFFFLTVRGGAPAFFIEAAAFPLVAGLLSLYLWGRKTPEASRTVAITFRFLLYGCFALGFIYLCFVLFQKS